MLQNNEFNPKCYFKYDKFQYEVTEPDGTIAKGKPKDFIDLEPSLPTKMEDNKQEAPAFKPTWLIDTSDMSVVPGSTVSEPYYTLSYSWNQSGDYFKNQHDDGYTRIDRGQHQIIAGFASIDSFGRKTFTSEVRYVKFEQLVQEIFQDFGARYLWWDQLCINQSNKEEKRREIKQMHKIYENACRTVVLIPELYWDYLRLRQYVGYYVDMLKLIECQWFKRVWTLVEGFKSNKLLFVGKDVHIYSETFARFRPNMINDADHSLLYTICATEKKWSACLALSHARKRATTKKHDYYFAFTNMFPEKLSGLNFSYDQDIQEVALDFYQRLAQNDPTILFFSAPSNRTAKYEKMMLSFEEESKPLPSWTGINGVHSEKIFAAGEFDHYSFGLSDGDYIVSGSTIKVTCASISVSIVKLHEYRFWRLHDTPSLADVKWIPRSTIYSNSDDDTRKKLRLYGYRNSDLIFAESGDFPGPEKRVDFGTFFNQLEISHVLPFIFGSSYRTPDVWGAFEKRADMGCMSLTERCDHCTILYGLRYTWDNGADAHTAAPVVINDGDYYRSIGLCVLNKNFTFLDIDTETKRTFVIR